MTIDFEQLREHYASLRDDELLGIERDDLTPMAQQCFDAEIERRDLGGEGAEHLEDGGGSRFAVHHPEHEPDWLEHAFPASVYSRTSNGAMDAAAARDALLAAGIPCEVTEHEVVPEEEPHQEIGHEYRVMVPAAFSLQATSVLDVAIFNVHLEAEWKTQLESLSDEDLNALNIESLCAGLLDRVNRLRKAYKEERARREDE